MGGRRCSKGGHPERDSLDPFRQPVEAPDNEGLGRPVGDLRLVPRRDLGAPPSHGAAELADLGRTRHIAQVGRQLVDPHERELGVAVGVQLADGLLSLSGLSR